MDLTWSDCIVGGIGGVGRGFRTPHSNVLIMETVVCTQSIMWTIKQPGLVPDTGHVVKEDQTTPISEVSECSTWTETQCKTFLRTCTVFS